MLERIKRPITAESLDNLVHLVLGNGCKEMQIIVHYRNNENAGLAGISLRDFVSQRNEAPNEYFFRCNAKTRKGRRIVYESKRTLMFFPEQREEKAFEAFLVADGVASALRQRFDTVDVNVFMGKGNMVTPAMWALWHDQAKRLGLEKYDPVDF